MRQNVYTLCTIVRAPSASMMAAVSSSHVCDSVRSSMGRGVRGRAPQPGERGGVSEEEGDGVNRGKVFQFEQSRKRRHGPRPSFIAQATLYHDFTHSLPNETMAGDSDLIRHHVRGDRRVNVTCYFVRETFTCEIQRAPKQYDRF